MKTCIFGGTFDPPHLGHLMIIEDLLKTGFEQVLILPNKKPPYKKVHTTDRQRLDMLHILTDDLGERVKIVGFELSQPEYTPTACSLKAISGSIKGELHFAVGSDNFNYLADWEDFDFLAKNVNFVVYDRGIKYKEVDVAYTKANNKVVNISSSSLQVTIEEEKLHPGILRYIKKRRLYQ